jgi:hypothetical protein
MSDSGRLADDENADIDVSTSVRMRSLRFKTVPSTRVWFEGFPDVVHSLRTERQNLPEEVKPGITYENVTVRWRARARAVAQPYLDSEEGDTADEAGSRSRSVPSGPRSAAALPEELGEEGEESYE